MDGRAANGTTVEASGSTCGVAGELGSGMLMMDARLDAGTDMLSLREAGRLPAHEVPTAPPAVHDSSSPSPSPSSASVERSGGSDSAHDERFPPALGAARRLSGESATSESQARGDMPTSFTGGTQEAASKR
eukprot:5744321-Prymnesium_polylepis.1